MSPLPLTDGLLTPAAGSLTRYSSGLWSTAESTGLECWWKVRSDWLSQIGTLQLCKQPGQTRLLWMLYFHHRYKKTEIFLSPVLQRKCCQTLRDTPGASWALLPCCTPLLACIAYQPSAQFQLCIQYLNRWDIFSTLVSSEASWKNCHRKSARSLYSTNYPIGHFDGKNIQTKKSVQCTAFWMP